MDKKGIFKFLSAVIKKSILFSSIALSNSPFSLDCHSLSYTVITSKLFENSFFNGTGKFSSSKMIFMFNSSDIEYLFKK